MTQAEIADRLEIALGTVGVHVSRGKAAIRRRLLSDEFDARETASWFGAEPFRPAPEWVPRYWTWCRCWDGLPQDEMWQEEMRLLRAEQERKRAEEARKWAEEAPLRAEEERRRHAEWRARLEERIRQRRLLEQGRPPEAG